jgi:Holliday junction resolvasome RuvABC endonuclease subunit
MDNGKLIEYGTEDFDSINDYIEKISEIKKYIIKLIKKYNPEVISIEDIQFQKSYEVYRKLAELKGVLENLLFEKEYLFFTISPSTWKSTCGVKGRKRVEQKANAQLFIKKNFNIDVDEDIADAICQCWHVSTKLVPNIVKEVK